MGRTRHTRKRHTRRKHKRRGTRHRRRTHHRGGVGVEMAATIEGITNIAAGISTAGVGGGRAEVFSISDKAPGDKRGMASDRRKANKFLKAVKRKSLKPKFKRLNRIKLSIFSSFIFNNIILHHSISFLSQLFSLFFVPIS